MHAFWVLMAAFGYFAVGIIWGTVRAWHIGVHRADGHPYYRCRHWCCDATADDAVLMAIVVFFWPIAMPVNLMGRFFRAVMNEPYLRNLPPKNGYDDSE